MATFQNIQITKLFLDKTPSARFVFGDNLIRKGYGGAAILRDHPQSIGFVTKKFPDNQDSSFYSVDEYKAVFEKEFSILVHNIEHNLNKTFYISQLGGGLANKYKIWDIIIKPNLTKRLKNYNNVVFCWNDN